MVDKKNTNKKGWFYLKNRLVVKISIRTVAPSSVHITISANCYRIITRFIDIFEVKRPLTVNLMRDSNSNFTRSYSLEREGL